MTPDDFRAEVVDPVLKLLDLHSAAASNLLLGTALVVVLIAKPLAALAIVALFGYPLKVGLPVAIALAQVGELSFVVATAASGLGLLTPDATNTLVAAAVASITLNPLLFRSIGWLERLRVRGEPGRSALSGSGSAAPPGRRAGRRRSPPASAPPA